ncbi:hypothetical protein MMC27_000113 [Xylographa pallens]|nr:hypothetical protein [Xylographa pallens]
MSCCGKREKLEDVTKEQQWDWLNLSDFRSTSCLTPLSYGILYISLLVSVACYVVDVFTAVNLLVRDQWNGIVKPVVPLTISRWIFAGCIILSWVLLVYRWTRAIRAMRTGGVAQSYLDPLAVRIQSIRMGVRGRGWRRFLVFAELTKSKKGSEYIALFTYFSFEAWLRIIFAEGPRNAINAMTLYSVMQADLVPVGDHATSNGHNAFTQFFYNLMVLAKSNGEEAAVLFGMLFTLIIWVISAISLAVACIFYVMFLWHHIPSQDGGLRKFCKRKIDRRLQKVVSIKVNNALAKDHTDQSKVDTKTGRAGEQPHELKRQPTLPILDPSSDDKLPEMPIVSRQGTQTSLPPYTTRPQIRNDNFPQELQRQPTVPDVSMDPIRPGAPSRSNTQYSAASDSSYASNAPLIGSANRMGYGPAGQHYPPETLSRMGSDRSMASRRPLMNRSGTSNSQMSTRSYTPAWQESGSGQGRRPGPPSRQNTGFSDQQSYGRSSPAPPSRQNTAANNYPPVRQNTASSDTQSYGRSSPTPPSRQNTGTSIYQTTGRSTPGLSPIDSQGRRKPTPPSLIDSYNRRPLPTQTPYAEAPQAFEMRPQPPPSVVQHPPPASRFVPYNPGFTPSSAQPDTAVPFPTAQNFASSPTHRNFSAPLRSARQHDYFSQKPHPPQRSGTAPLPPTVTYDDSIYDSYGTGEEEVPRRMPLPRAATTGPGGGGWQGQRQYRPGAY